MVDALARMAEVGKPWTADNVSLVEPPPPALINVRGAGDDVAFAAAVGGATGVALPVEANRFATSGDVSIAWLGPDEWLIIAPGGQEGALCTAMESALEGRHHAVTDVSANRSVFRLSGTGVRDLLAAGSPFDFHPRNFAAGDCTQTVLARTGAIILQRDDAPSYDILVRRSFARYLWQWLETAARLAG